MRHEEKKNRSNHVRAIKVKEEEGGGRGGGDALGSVSNVSLKLTWRTMVDHTDISRSKLQPMEGHEGVSSGRSYSHWRFILQVYPAELLLMERILHRRTGKV